MGATIHHFEHPEETAGIKRLSIKTNPDYGAYYGVCSGDGCAHHVCPGDETYSQEQDYKYEAYVRGESFGGHYPLAHGFDHWSSGRKRPEKGEDRYEPYGLSFRPYPGAV